MRLGGFLRCRRSATPPIQRANRFAKLLGSVLGLVIGSFLNVVIHRLPQLLEREWLGDAAGYLQDGAAIGRVLGTKPQRTAELARQGEALAADVAALPAMSLSRPRSRCPQCGHQLAWHENIPLLGWLRLGGKCSACGSRISVRYPLVEALTGTLFAAAVGPGSAGAGASGTPYSVRMASIFG